MLIVLGILSFLLIIGIIISLLPVKVSLDYSRVNKDDNLKIRAEALFGLINYRLELSYIKLKRKYLLPFLELHAEFFGAKGKKGDDEVLEDFGLRSFEIKTALEKIRFLFKIVDQYEALFEMVESYFREDRYSGQLRMENAVIFRIMGMLFFGIRGDCQKLVWHTRFGFPDAALTGVSTGLAWAGKAIVLELLSMVCNMKTIPDIMVTPDFNTPRLDTKLESIFSVRIGNIMTTGFKILLKGYKRRVKHGRPPD